MSSRPTPSARKIDHLVVLMLENRSFDCMLGRLYPKSETFDGLDGSESNSWRRPDGILEEIRVWNSVDLGPEDASIPHVDPGERFDDITMQIFGPNAPSGAKPTMSGFVENFVRQPHRGLPLDPREVMHYFTAAQTPALSALASSFGVSDRWFSSAPCETWPNRFFAHTGTAGGHVNNGPTRFPIALPRSLPTIFRRLESKGHDWNVYFHDLPQTAALTGLWSRLLTHFCLFDDEFDRHAREARLPAYSFIEPRYYPSLAGGKIPSDQHPPHNILYGEQLVAAVYNSLRRSPLWERTLLVVTYDEHGGCYDHAPPPPATPPGGPYYDGFEFDRYGVRVPAVVVSPYVPSGSVIRPPPSSDGSPSPPFDHCSIIATLEAVFDLGAPMSPRVAAAPDLLCALTLERPENNGPESVVVNMREPSASEWRTHFGRPRNSLQRSMLNPLTAAPATLARASAHIRRFGSRAAAKRRGS